MTRREKIEERLRSDPHDPFLNYSYAMELAKEADLAAARRAFGRVREIDPQYVPAYFQEAQLLAGRGETDDARKLLLDGITVARQVGDTHALGEMTEFLESL